MRAGAGMTPSEAGDSLQGGAGSPATGQIRVVLPGHLARLAGLAEREVRVALDVEPDTRPTVGAVLRALEQTLPGLGGTLIEPHPDGTSRVRPYLRLLAGEQDLMPAGPDGPRRCRERIGRFAGLPRKAGGFPSRPANGHSWGRLLDAWGAGSHKAQKLPGHGQGVPSPELP